MTHQDICCHIELSEDMSVDHIFTQYMCVRIIVCSRCPTLRHTQRLTKKNLHRIVRRCSYYMCTDTNTDSHWVLFPFYQHLCRLQPDFFAPNSLTAILKFGNNKHSFVTAKFLCILHILRILTQELNFN